VQEDPDTQLVAELPSHGQRLLEVLPAELAVPEDVLHATLNSECAEPRATRIGRSVRQQHLRPLQSLVSGIRGPVVLERHEELEPQVPLGVLAGPSECSPHVVPLRDHEVVTHLTLDVRCETRRERDDEVVLRVLFAKRTVFALSRQLLRRELTDRLEHPVTRRLVLTPPDEILVEQRLQRVGVTVAHGLRRLECAAACEHGERAEKALLRRLE
jgi:hypothetical protein